ncbi:CHAP domain-containing protein [Nonomuraea sp. NPDC048916]|uniref:CHAP domain-containing protein n=1 Tax=Nonomuraea sp. NPDC048916 TaxID=3154232 RepID=UPI0033DFEA29
MTPETQKFIDLLESQLGYSEKSGAYTKFGDWYGKNVEFDADYSAAPWCDMLLSWAAHKLGYEEWMGQFAWTIGHARWFKKNDAWGRKPEPGAFVFFDWDGSGSIGAIDHVGVVTRVEGNTIHTIEGNIDGGVLKRKERDTSKVVGYGYPERIKERLDERLAEQQARENASRDRANEPTTNATDVGRLQNGPLSSLIPYSEVRQEAQPPLPAETAPSRAPRDEAQRNEAQQAGAPASAATQAQGKVQSSDTPRTTTTAPSAGVGQAAKKGKHAKPATADTKTVTSEPLPVLVDASASHPVPALGSPALIGSALVAALAMLAIAKTRQLRVRPALAAPAPVEPAAPARRGHRRRKPRTAFTVALLASPVPETVEPATRVITQPVTPAPLVPVGGAQPVTPALLVPVGGAPPFAPVVVPDIPEATSDFDAFTPSATPLRGARGPRYVPTEPWPAPAPVRHPFESPIRARRPFPALDDTWQEPDGLPRAHEAARSPQSHTHRRDGGYYGRRRRSGHPIEEPAAFTPDAPLRGRRHRTSDAHRAETHRSDQRWSDPRFSDPRRADAPWPSPRRAEAHRAEAHRADPHRAEPSRPAPHQGDALFAEPRGDAYWADALWPMPPGPDAPRGGALSAEEDAPPGRRHRVTDAYLDEPPVRNAVPRGRRHRAAAHATEAPALVTASGADQRKGSRRGRHRA